MAPKRPVLDLTRIRSIAKVVGLHEIYSNETSCVVSFSRPAKDSKSQVRFNVYYTTGTVATCLNHPKQGKTQLFRRNVTDYGTLLAIFKNPRVHIGTGYHRIEERNDEHQHDPPNGTRQGIDEVRRHFSIGSRAYVSGFANCTIRSEILTHGRHSGRIRVQYYDGAIYHVLPEQLEDAMDEAVDEETAARKEFGRLTREKAKLREEMKRLQEEIDQMEDETKEAAAIMTQFVEERKRQEEEHLERKRLEAERKAKEEAERKKQELIDAALKAAAEAKAQKEAERAARGTSLAYSLPQMEHVKNVFGASVATIACGGHATIMLHEGGSQSWTRGLPTQLYNKLNGRQKTLPKPDHVALGSRDRYYVRFADGKSQWVGCDAMTKLLHETNKRVASLAFGEDWNSYFVVFTDGGWQYGNVPQSLIDVIERRGRRGDLTCVSLGPDGEYFLRARNGRMWWGGMATLGMQTAAKVKDGIRFMDFGDDDAFLIRYTS